MEWDKQKWVLLATGAGMLAGLAAKKATGKAWLTLLDEDELPEEKADPSTGELVAWAVCSASLMALSSTAVKLIIEEAGRRGETNFLAIDED